MQTKDMSAKEQCCALLCHLEEKRAGIFDSSKHLTLPSARIFLSLPRSQWKTYNCTIFFMVLFCCRCFAFVWLLSFVLSRCMFINSQFLFRLNNNICGQWVRNFSCFFSVLLFLSKEQQIRKMTTEKKVRKSSKSKERVERFRQSRTFRPNKQLFCVVQYENSLICPSFRNVRARFSCFLVCCLEYICKAYSSKHTHRDRQCEWWECSVCVSERSICHYCAPRAFTGQTNQTMPYTIRNAMTAISINKSLYLLWKIHSNRGGTTTTDDNLMMMMMIRNTNK